LVVEVKDEDGDPVCDVAVDACDWGVRQTGEDGTADYGKVPAGTHLVTARKAGHGPARNQPEGQDFEEDVTVTDGSTTTVALVQHPLCANVSFCEGPTTRSKYFGFDHKTNLVATPGTDEYWLPTRAAGSLSLPGNKQTRDGARLI
jgi:hypothetical protein